MTTPDRPHVGLVLEHSLGHVTHAENLQAIISGQETIRASYLPIAYHGSGWAARVPGYSNWTVRAGMLARRGVRRLERTDPVDALFVHTQVPAILLGRAMSKVPTVVSLDATPRQYDAMGAAYNHRPGRPSIERVKDRLNERCFDRAARIVTWSEWTKDGEDGLVQGYGVDPDKVTVIHPGVWCEQWVHPPADAPVRRSDGIVRVLFVGADLVRKGGDLLLEAFRLLRRRHGDSVELHLVTKTAVPAQPGVHHYPNMSPNSEALRALYHRCDIFCLPTRADCLALVLAEAGATGLPLVSTTVGGIPEIVVEGQTGRTVPTDDVTALVAALDELIGDESRRVALGTGARSHVLANFDAGRNVLHLVELLAGVARTRS